MARTIDTAFTRTRAEFFEPKLLERGGYTNYLDNESRASSNEVSARRFGSNLPRLVEAKKKYDPGNMFGKVSVFLEKCNSILIPLHQWFGIIPN